MQRPDLKSLKNRVLGIRRDVIRMMRLKFIGVAMAILLAVFITMLSAINMIMNTVSQSQSARLLQQIAESDRYNTIEPMEDMRMYGQPPPDSSEPTTEETQAVPTVDAAAEVSPGGIMSLSYEGGDGDDSIPDLYFRPIGGWEWWNMPTDEGNRDREERRAPTERTPDSEPDDDEGYDDETRPPEWQRPTEETPPPRTNEAPATEAPHTAEPPPAEEPPTPAPEPEIPENIPAVETTEPPTPVTEAPTETQTVTETETETETVPETPPTTQAPREPREPRMDRWKVPITIDHFAILVDADGGFIGIRNTENYTEDEAAEIMEGILAKKRTAGMYGWLQFCTAEKEYGTLLVITDKTSDQGLLNNLFRTTVIIGIVMLLVLLTILIFLSRWITQPVQQAFARQKQFVSDAGHELKTPIAVLTTNADILQDEIGENKWLIYMQEQIGRMNQLVGDLLRLARMDNATQEYTFKEFDLSLAVAATTLPFESAAFEQRKSLELDVQPDVRYCGSEQHIRQLCAIFIDNALKYSSDNGIIKVTLMQRGDHQILEFYNTGCEISQSETDKIFERFYRGDKARNSTKKSGYGLGLAIAKSIMEVHKIKFQVTCEQGKWIRFLLTL